MANRGTVLLDWRALACLLAVIAVGVAELLTPENSGIWALAILPIGISALLGSASLVLLVAGIAALLQGAAYVAHGPDSGMSSGSFAVLAVAGALSVGLAAFVGHSRRAGSLVIGPKAIEGIFDSLLVGHGAVMLLVDPESGRILQANRAAADFYGYGEGTLSSLRVSDLNMLPPDEIAALLASAAERAAQVFVVPHRLADGSVRQVEVHSSPFRVGTSMALLSVIVDVTDALAAREELARSERVLRLLVEASSAMTLEVSEDGVILAASEGSLRLLGRETAELKGRPLEELVDPADEALASLPFTGDPALQSGALPLTLIREDGGRVRVALTWHREEAADRAAVFTCALRDVEAETVLSETLVESEARFRMIAQSATDGVFQADCAGRITWASAGFARLSGRSLGNVVGMSGFDMIHVDDRELAVRQLERALGGDREVVRVRLESPSGETRWVEASMAPVVANGVAVSIVGGLRDVQAETEAYFALADSEQRYRLLAENASQVVFRLGAGGSFDWVSEGTKGVLGKHPAQVIGIPIFDLVATEDHDRVFNSLQEAAAGEQGSLRVRVYVDGDRRWIELSRMAVMTDGVVSAFVGSMTDVTREHEALEALEVRERQYRLIVENSSDVVLLVNRGMIEWVAPSIVNALGWHPSQWQDRPWAQFAHRDDVELVGSSFGKGSAGGTDLVRARWRAADGSFHWTEMHSGPFKDSEGRIVGVATSLRIADDVVEVERLLRQRADHDELTGALKRDAALARLSSGEGPQRREPGAEVGLMFIDLDGFKGINDAFGHQAGDEFLRAVSMRVSSAIRPSDTFARLGGDEFLVILEGLHDLHEAEMMAQRVRLMIAEPVPTHAGEITGSASIGVTLATLGDSPEGTLARADTAMYEAKGKGRNQVVAIQGLGPTWGFD